MDLRIFLFVILIFSISFYFVPVENLKKISNDEDIALFIFEEPVMYSLDEEGLSKVVISKQTVRYKSKDEMYYANITLNNKDKTKNFMSENLKSDLIVKKGDIYTLTHNVKYKRDDFIKIDTQHLVYDDLKKIATNNRPFQAQYHQNRYDGESLYFEVDKNIIKSKNTHFEIQMNKK